MKKNLVTLGSAAVLAVYTAGYIRTRPAAQGFADEPIARRPMGPPVGEEIAADTTQRSKAPARPPRTASHTTTPELSTAVVASVADSTPPTSTPTRITPAAVPVAPTTVPPVDTATPPVEKPLAQWRDGTYSGWGTSRHGDIQASVEIQNGRVVAATITQCLTRYSCSLISALVGQVVTRQSADVDYISGATQSSNAFYTAIAEALKQAR